MSQATFTLNETDVAKKEASALNANIECNISPMVVMSILNHFQRRPSNKARSNQKQHLYPSFVIGLLFGRKNIASNSITINDAFGLETQINPETNEVALELAVAKQALKLHAMAHPNDRLVGWYRTGLTIEASSTSIHDMIIIKQLSPLSNKVSKKAGAELKVSEYIHLLIDTALKNDELSIKSYTTVPIFCPLQQIEYETFLKAKKQRDRGQNQANSGKGRRKKRRKNKNPNKSEESTKSSSPQKEQEMALEPLEEIEKPYPIFYRFKQIISNYYAMESERIGLDMIINSEPEGTALDAPSMLMNDTNHLESVLQALLNNLEEVEHYVLQVTSGQIEGDEALGWLIGDALNSVPNLSPQKFEVMISNRLQDFLMMVYLGKMTKAQLTICDKINKVLPSTVPGFEPNK